ncbi:DUF669 domain-containing protein [Clostridium botulinum]|nr:DUF669 domain-containing protein [Clostridium botulinum]NFO48399.1 DUF669 domain-containing protein [Clostridium botulinum]
MSIFAKFNNKVDKDQLEKDMAEAKDNQGGDFKEIPVGNYEVEVEKIECKETKKGDPMVSIWFNILAGDYKGCKLFYNHVLQVNSKNLGWQMNKVIDFVDTLGTEIENVNQSDLEVLETWLNDVFDKIEELGLEYELEFGKDKKDFDTYKILEVFED